MAHREQERSRGAGGGPWADIELSSASVSAPNGGALWGFRDGSSVCRRAFCSARWAVPGAGLTSLGLPQWRGSPPSMGGRSPRLKIKARVALSRAQPPAVGGFLTLFFVAAMASLPGGGGLSIWGRWWLWWHLGGFWSHLSCGAASGWRGGVS